MNETSPVTPESFQQNVVGAMEGAKEANVQTVESQRERARAEASPDVDSKYSKLMEKLQNRLSKVAQEHADRATKHENRISDIDQRIESFKQKEAGTAAARSQKEGLSQELKSHAAEATTGLEEIVKVETKVKIKGPNLLERVRNWFDEGARKAEVMKAEKDAGVAFVARTTAEGLKGLAERIADNKRSMARGEALG